MPAGKLYLAAASKKQGRKRRGRALMIQNKKRYNNRYSQLVICKRPVCPEQILVPLKYVSEKIDILCTSGAGNYHLFNFNNCYDPDRTGTGHQPLGWDQWVAFYGIYRVISASVKVVAINTTDDNPFHMALNFSGSTAGATGVDASAEGRGKSRYGGDQQKILSARAFRRGHSVFGVSKSQYRNDDLYRGPTSGAPSKEGIIQIWVIPFDEATTTTISFKAEITYYVMFQNSKLLVQS